MVLVEAQSTRCHFAPFSANRLNRSPSNISRYSAYATRAFATAAFPASSDLPNSSSFPSTAVSMRETKKLATAAIPSIDSPVSARSSKPEMYASATFLYASTAKSRVVFTLIPAAVDCRIASSPSSVPGILIITLGRSRRCQRCCAASMVASVSRASEGATSMLT